MLKLEQSWIFCTVIRFFVLTNRRAPYLGYEQENEIKLEMDRLAKTRFESEQRLFMFSLFIAMFLLFQ